VTVVHDLTTHSAPPTSYTITVDSTRPPETSSAAGQRLRVLGRALNVECRARQCSLAKLRVGQDWLHLDNRYFQHLIDDGRGSVRSRPIRLGDMDQTGCCQLEGVAPGSWLRLPTAARRRYQGSRTDRRCGIRFRRRPCLQRVRPLPRSSSGSRQAGSTMRAARGQTTSCNQPTRNDRRRRAALAGLRGGVTSCLSSWKTPTAKPWSAARAAVGCGSYRQLRPTLTGTPIGSAQWH
jgi:hypothetical protein